MAALYELEARILSASDLKNVNWRHGQLEPYAVVWIQPQTKCATYADTGGGASYSWDQKLIIPFSTLIPASTLHIDLMHAECAVGSAELPLRDVGFESRATRTHQLKRPSGRPQGKVEVELTIRQLGGTPKIAGMDEDNGYSGFRRRPIL